MIYINNIYNDIKINQQLEPPGYRGWAVSLWPAPCDRLVWPHLFVIVHSSLNCIWVRARGRGQWSDDEWQGGHANSHCFSPTSHIRTSHCTVAVAAVVADDCTVCTVIVNVADNWGLSTDVCLISLLSLSAWLIMTKEQNALTGELGGGN